MRTRGELLTRFLFPSYYRMVSQEEKLIVNEKRTHLCVEIAMSLKLTLARRYASIGESDGGPDLSRRVSCVQG
jgi:hypothetical protein